MFTGIVTHIGILKLKEEQDKALRVVITVDLPQDKLFIGQSISCDGMCLTLTEIEKRDLTFFISQESLNKTKAGSWNIGQEINIEVAMQAKDFLAGHMVSGHVDSVVEVKNIKEESDSKSIELKASKDQLEYLVDKGSVTLDGVSLTVNKVFENSFLLNIIPHTWQNTNFRNLKIADKLNFEADVIAKYVKKYTK